jgi:hypothetical protein
MKEHGIGGIPIVDENRILKELLLIEIYVSKKQYKTN